jgi:hypothetical protein
MHARVLIDQRRKVRILMVLMLLTAWIVTLHRITWVYIGVDHMLREWPMHASALWRWLRHVLREPISGTMEMRNWHGHMRVGEDWQTVTVVTALGIGAKLAARGLLRHVI